MKVNSGNIEMRTLSNDEIESVSGGIHPVAVLILAAAAGAGWKLGSSVNWGTVGNVLQQAGRAAGNAAKAVVDFIKFW